MDELGRMPLWVLSSDKSAFQKKNKVETYTGSPVSHRHTARANPAFCWASPAGPAELGYLAQLTWRGWAIAQLAPRLGYAERTGPEPERSADLARALLNL